MRADTLDLLRCPYCGGRLELVESMFHRHEGDAVLDGMLACHCCIFPVIEGIPVMHLDPPAPTARAHVEAGRPDMARRVMFGLETEEEAAEFDRVATSAQATYRDIVEALGPRFEGGYFLCRFSDPTYLVADAVVRSTAARVLREGGRAVDLCGGSGHLTRSLLDLSAQPAVLGDLHFSKIWLARRFTAPGCEGVCCNGNDPLPFARGAFRYAVCSDALHYLWTKRQFALEMLRLVDDDSGRGAAVISHAHNQRQWSPSPGQPLPPEGYRDLFETCEPRLFAEAGLLADVIRGGPLDLSRLDSAATLDADPALTVVVSRRADLFASYALEPPAPRRGELRVNPLYAVEAEGAQVRLSLRFPSADYEEEYGACRQYLPEQVVVEPATLAGLGTKPLTPAQTDLVRRRVLLDLPAKYY